MSLEEWCNQLSLGEFMSSILHLMPLFYPMDPDPYSEYGSGPQSSEYGYSLYPDLQHCF